MREIAEHTGNYWSLLQCWRMSSRQYLTFIVGDRKSTVSRRRCASLAGWSHVESASGSAP